MESIDYQADRNLDRGQIMRFAECNFIRNQENFIITGSTGIGKSYIATAIGHQACTLGFKVYYANLGKLFSRLKMGKLRSIYFVMCLSDKKSIIKSDYSYSKLFPDSFDLAIPI
jgi:hypothetical protein